MATKRDLIIKKRHMRSSRRQEPEEQYEQKPAAEKKPRKKRRRYGRSVVWPILFRLLLVTALVMMVVLIWRNWDHLAPDAVVGWFDNLVTGGEGGDGYPVTISGSSVISMSEFNSQAAVLTDSSLLVYNSGGAAVVRRSHTYADPLLETSGNYLLLAEIGGTHYTLGTKKTVVYEGQVDNEIRSAAVDSAGRVALVTESSQSYMSEVLVFSHTGEKLFHWYSVDQIVIDVAISPNGKRVAVLGLSAKEGEMYSTIQIFLLAGQENTVQATYGAGGTMMTALHYYGNGNVAAVGDNALWVFSPGEEASVVSYDGSVLLGYAFSDGGIGVVTRRYGESRDGTLTVVTPAGKKTATVDFEGDFRHLDEASGGFYLLTDSTLYKADTVGFAKQTAVSSDGLQVVELGGRPLVLSLTMLSRYSWS